ncbi:hypothetical protein AMJ86_06805 [bacterium SM23_57]|nr:MAG: hypothetical protein AMJ86_06805 [bacterium SM23_57]
MSNYNDSWHWAAQNQLRTTIRSSLITQVSAEATLAAISYHGETEISPQDLLPEPLQNQAQNIPTIIYDNRIYLDRAMIDIFTGNIRWQIGIQPLRWGTGYAWNPTDLFTTKSPVDPTYIEEGVNAIKISIPWRTDGNISGIWVPEDTWESSGKGIKWLDHLAGFDISVSYLERTLFPIPIPAFTGKERYVGWDITGEILGPGIWSEGTILLEPDLDDPLRLVAGIDYTTWDGWYFKLEAFHNGIGKESEQDYTVNDWLELLYRPNTFLGKDYGLLGIEKSLGNFWRASLYGIGNITDGSILINPWLYYSISMSAEIMVSVGIPVGDDIDEFHQGSSSGFIRLHVYF